MIPTSKQELRAYWESVGVKLDTRLCQDIIGKNEFSEIVERVGLPMQEWWLFRFCSSVTVSDSPPGVVQFGQWGNDWNLYWRKQDGSCYYATRANELHFINGSFFAFNQSMVIYDRGYRQIQKECPGDTGEDWDKGDLITEWNKREMESIDHAAFGDSENFWPCLLHSIG